MAKQFARFQVSSRLPHLLSQEYSSSEKALKELVDTSAHGRPGRGRRQRTGGAGRGQQMTSGARKTDPDAAGHRPSGARLRCLLPRGLPKDKVLQTFGAHIFFDDQETHVQAASSVVPAGKVPYDKGGSLRAANRKTFTDLQKAKADIKE